MAWKHSSSPLPFCCRHLALFLPETTTRSSPVWHEARATASKLLQRERSKSELRCVIFIFHNLFPIFLCFCRVDVSWLFCDGQILWGKITGRVRSDQKLKFTFGRRIWLKCTLEFQYENKGSESKSKIICRCRWINKEEWDAVSNAKVLVMSVTIDNAINCHSHLAGL